MDGEGVVREGRHKIATGAFCEGHSLIISHSEGVREPGAEKYETSPGQVHTWERTVYSAPPSYLSQGDGDSYHKA